VEPLQAIHHGASGYRPVPRHVALAFEFAGLEELSDAGRRYPQYARGLRRTIDVVAVAPSLSHRDRSSERRAKMLWS
jgi:hypothetical protein